ncbi:DUF1810 family protein [Croceibacterium sp. LX-88]|jgi:uncharacterized protein (DUF1810 family)|uniref:DUF1810 family protein n=1 Tax=Croceibacterium selenioxidans TaxID=2838833 RepID=A0ABS5W538_9SPHN|nr:DUF1810 domain-containing protein [Croceibacterium selenioxidans]MBT2134611.1 DUF1810 family protein [Croceibacterium selenioxidans]
MSPVQFEQDADPFNLKRFVVAQQATYATALCELRRGAKRTHWMWYVFPQLRGLGRSELAQRFAITSIEEAKAYLAHRPLGTRLLECVEVLQELPEMRVEQVFGVVDAMKLRSSLTLFAEASQAKLFQAALERWFDGPDLMTLRLLNEGD